MRRVPPLVCCAAAGAVALFACGGRAVDTGGTSSTGTASGGPATRGDSRSCGGASGSPTIIAAGRAEPINLVAAGGAAFWCEIDDVRRREKFFLARWDRRTSELTRIESGSCLATTADAASVFWTQAGNRLSVAPFDLGTSMVAFSTPPPPPSGSVTPEGWYAVAVDDDRVYWTDHRAAGGVFAGSKGGGSSFLLARESFPTGVTADRDAVYWTTDQGVTKWPKATQQPVLLTHEPALGGLGSPNVAVDDRYVYWISVGGLERTSKDGATTDRMYANEAERFVVTVSIQGGCLYFGAGDGLYRMPLGGGTPSLLRTAATHLNIFWFAADETDLYWSEWSGYAPGNVFRLSLAP